MLKNKKYIKQKNYRQIFKKKNQFFFDFKRFKLAQSPINPLDYFWAVKLQMRNLESVGRIDAPPFEPQVPQFF